MNNAMNAAETALLISIYSAKYPRTCELARQGHAAAVDALQCSTIGDEVADSVAAACMALRDRGVSWGAIYITACSCARKARSSRAQIILHRMASQAERCLPAGW